MAKSLLELKNMYVRKFSFSLMMKGQGKNLLRTELKCNVCGETHLAWEVHQIPYYPEAKAIPEECQEGDTMLACNKCIEEKQLTLLNNDASLNFDALNLAIKELSENLTE